MGHLGQPVQDRLRGIEVREPLGEIHGVIFQGYTGHAPDHGVGEVGGALGKRLGHGDHSLSLVLIV